MQEQRISLYFRDERSDKEYHLQLLGKDDGFVVNYQNGPRGGTLASGTKTPKPLDYEAARKKYDKVVREKTSKGYTEGESGQAYQSTSLEEHFTGIVPQLLNPLTEEEAQQLIEDPLYILQEKFDGERRLVRLDKADGTVCATGINRRGLAVALPVRVVEALVATLATQTPLALDGEMVGEQLVVFDVLEFEGRNLREETLQSRLASLNRVAEALSGAQAGTDVTVAETHWCTGPKRETYERLKSQGREGAVFKRLTATYTAGRPNSGGPQRKRKFTHSATVFVEKTNAGKRSVAVGVLDVDGKTVALGSVKIPTNHEIPEKGALVEVEYLYAFRGGSLFQAQYRGARKDLERSAASVQQLHYKSADSDEDDDNAE
jgi:bifunctional non-homologous end joining protein LigD